MADPMVVFGVPAQIGVLAYLEGYVAGCNMDWSALGYYPFGKYSTYRSTIENAAGFEFIPWYPYDGGVDNWRYFNLIFPASFERPIQWDLLDASGAVLFDNLPFGDPGYTQFGRQQDANGNWFQPLSYRGVPYVVYWTRKQFTNFATGDFITVPLYPDTITFKMRVHTVRTDPPTFSPPAGAVGSYPHSISIAGPTGTEITWKEFTISDPAETPTPGSGGWSALAATPVTATVSAAGKELRAQARKAGQAFSNVASASYT